LTFGLQQVTNNIVTRRKQDVTKNDVGSFEKPRFAYCNKQQSLQLGVNTQILHYSATTEIGEISWLNKGSHKALSI
jgi:hypothetical protein